MLTIDEVRNISFRRANLGGYRPDDVEVFINNVVDTLENDRAEKKELVKKLDILAKRIEEYRLDEENVRGALINAQRVMEKSRKEAEEEASKIIAEAKQEAQNIVMEANSSIVDQKNNYLRLQADATVLREQLLEIYKNHMSLVENLPTGDVIGKTKAELDEKYPVMDSTPAAGSEAKDIVDEVANEAAEQNSDIVDIAAEFSDESAALEEEKTVVNSVNS